MSNEKMFVRLRAIGVAVAACFALAGCQEPNSHASTNTEAEARPPSSAALSGDQAKLTVYAQSGAPKPFTTCNLEAVSGTTFGTQPVTLKADAASTFTGWVFAEGLSHPVYWLRFDSERGGRHLQAPLPLTVGRVDIVAAYQDAPKASGFSEAIPAGALPAGSYHVYIAADSGGTTYICDSGRHVDVAF